MITIVSSPASNRVLLDANNTEITITSTNGNGYYFRAKIYINDVLFDEQGWSRQDEFTAVKDLVKLYNAYFSSVFVPFSANGLAEQTALKKKVSIVIEERNLSTDAVSATATLPDFYFMYNAVPAHFSDSDKIKVLGISATVNQVPDTGKMIIPFYVNATAEAVSVTVKDNFGTTLNTQTISTFTGKKVFLYQFDLSEVTLANNTLYFEAVISCGETTQTLQYRLIRFPNFAIKEIWFENNFGYFLPAYFDGEMKNENNLTISDYQQKDGSSVIFEIQEEATYTINTGYLLEDEKAIVNQVINSLEVWFLVNNNWQKINTKTKKQLEYRDSQNSYEEDLNFSFMKTGKISNV